jgi:hypothetical protein
VAERRDALKRSVDQRDGELGRLRVSLDGGEPLRPARDAIARLETQLKSVGYDGVRHEAVRQELNALREAPRRFVKLMEAQRNLTDWCARRAALGDERAGLEVRARGPAR